VARLLETEALLRNQLAVLVGKSLALLALCCFLTMGLFSSLACSRLGGLRAEHLFFRWDHQIVNNVIWAFHRKPFKRLGLPGVRPFGDACLDVILSALFSVE
jgi:hypothetical protein